jgi:uncharacterized damage-inducible protein DinB
MSISESLLPEFDHEMAGTRSVLANVTDLILGWKAHERSNTVGWVASHLADIPSWTDVCINQDSFDVAPPGQPPHQTIVLDGVDEILGVFDRNVDLARETIAATDDAQYFKPWSLLKGGEVQMTIPRMAVVRSFILNHSIHHRAHLCVYLRLNDLPVPALYGPSADDGRE